MVRNICAKYLQRPSPVAYNFFCIHFHVNKSAFFMPGFFLKVKPYYGAFFFYSYELFI